MTRLRAWLLRLLVGEVYVVADGPKIVGVAASLQGAELKRIDWARKWVSGIPNPDTAAVVEQSVYRRQRIELHRLRDVD